MTDARFVDGLIAKAPRQGAPTFVKARLSVKRNELIAWLEKEGGEWVNLDIKESKNGKWYAQVNDWKPEQKESRETETTWNKEEIPSVDYPEEEIDVDDIPF
jgi:hypothetical protein